MQWTPPQDGRGQELPKQKISSQEEIGTINKLGVVGKEEYPGDSFRVTDQGKSSHVSSVENWVTLHKIADRNDTAIKALVMILTGRTLDSAVMTTRAEK
jgi:hypothetical protein